MNECTCNNRLPHEWDESICSEATVSQLKAQAKKSREYELRQYRSVVRELVEALEKTVAALVSYKKYVPEPYKQNPIYILGSVEAEQLAKEVLKRAEELLQEKEEK